MKYNDSLNLFGTYISHRESVELTRIVRDKMSDLILISTSLLVYNRINSVCAEFGYVLKQWNSVDDLFEVEVLPKSSFVLVSCVDSKENPGNIIQVVRQVFPNSFVAAIISSDQTNEQAAYAKKCGADAIFLENEFYESSKIEYVASQVIKATYIPIKANELYAETEMPFSVFHLLPQHGKFLHCSWEGDILNESKVKKFKSVGELYIKRTDADKFKKYSESHTDGSAEGLAKRCRAQFISLYSNYNDLVLMLTDSSESSSFKKGGELLAKCKALCSDLLGPLASLGNAYDVINNTNIGDFGSVERSPSVASYAGIFALNSGIDNVEDVMLAAMLADVGILSLHPNITRKIRQGKINELTKSEKEEYENHPYKSLSLLSDRKLPVPLHIKEMIQLSHEHEDGSGFPKGKFGKAIPEGTQIIQLSELIDFRSLVKIGAPRPNTLKIIKDTFDESYASGKHKKALLTKLAS